jgi:hypothetical protein
MRLRHCAQESTVGCGVGADTTRVPARRGRCRTALSCSLLPQERSGHGLASALLLGPEMSEALVEWVRTARWAPATQGGGGQGFPVECAATGELGYAKPVAVAQEVLGYRLALLVGAPVPEAILGLVDGKMMSVSKSWGPQSLDVPKVLQLLPGDVALATALRQASALLPYHAWLGTEDLKDAHLVVRGPTPGVYEVASIDFQYATLWRPDAQGTVAVPNGPPALLAHQDPVVIEQAVARIEAQTNDAVVAVASDLPEEVLPAPEKTRIAGILAARRAALRGAIKNAGWIT